jgi:hypothetical protein
MGTDKVTVNESGHVVVSAYADTNGNFMASDIGFKNYLINGCFRFWQRAISQTANGYGSADRWVVSNAGTTKTATRQPFSLGQTEVPGNPEFF